MVCRASSGPLKAGIGWVEIELGFCASIKAVPVWRRITGNTSCVAEAHKTNKDMICLVVTICRQSSVRRQSCVLAVPGRGTMTPWRD